MARLASNSPCVTCWFNHKLKASFTMPDTKLAHSREERRSLVCPENCGSCSFTEIICAQQSQLSSGVNLIPRGNKLRNSQNSRKASDMPCRKPETCVPPNGVGTRLT